MTSRTLNFTKAIIILLVMVISNQTHAQIEVYRTFEDYQNGVSEKFDTYRGAGHSSGRVFLMFYNEMEKKKKNVKCKEMWGFKYNGALFRNEIFVGQPARVIIAGDIIYYENGIAHLDMIRYNKNEGEFSLGAYCYLSKDLNSKMIALSITDENHEKSFAEFKEQFPEFEDIYECMGKDYSPRVVATCVAEYEEENEDDNE